MAIILDDFIYKVGVAAAIFFSLICLLGLISDIRRRRRLQNERDVENNNPIPLVQTVNVRQGVEDIDWTFPVTIEIVDKVINRDDFSLYFLKKATVQSNHYLPKSQEYCYFEIKILELKENQSLFIGLATKFIHQDCIPGIVDNSLSFETSTGHTYHSGKKIEWTNEKIIQTGDVIGCLITHGNPSLVTYTYNGEIMDSIPMLEHSLNVYPTIHSIDSCCIQFNFGHNEFLFSKANLFRYGLVSTNTLSELPPAYSNESNMSTNYANHSPL